LQKPISTKATDKQKVIALLGSERFLLFSLINDTPKVLILDILLSYNSYPKKGIFYIIINYNA